ncbi:hypothetical protein S245_067874 [Arachis hypogaea]
MLEKASVSLRTWRMMKLLLVLTRKNYHNLTPWKLLGCRNSGTIKCGQPYLHRIGNETCQNSNSEPYNIPEAENYDPSERENGVHDIDVYGSSSLDGEVGKILNQMVPIPHIP